jgi:hypothetical protein
VLSVSYERNVTDQVLPERTVIITVSIYKSIAMLLILSPSKDILKIQDFIAGIQNPKDIPEGPGQRRSHRPNACAW